MEKGEQENKTVSQEAYSKIKRKPGEFYFSGTPKMRDSMSIKKEIIDALMTHKLYRANPGKESSVFFLK